MLKRYYIDVSALTSDEIDKLKSQIDMFDFLTTEKISNIDFRVIGLDVTIDDSHDLYKIADIPPECTVKEIL